MSALLLLGLVVPATAYAEGWRDDLGAVPDRVYEASIVPLVGEIEPLSAETTDGDEKVITLDTDILFEFGKADLSDEARKQIAELVGEVPQGETIKVHGHTDSIAPDSFNQKLSEERAEAVAKVIRTARPDLRLQVKGFGESHPVEPNEAGGKDDPEGRAKNRRVEVRYGT